MELNNSTGQHRICPHCHATIEWLAFAEDRTVTGEFRDGVHYEVDSWPIGEDSMSYECPKCGHVLFQDERRASAFMGRQLQRRRHDQRTSGASKKARNDSPKDQQLVLK